jgi:glycerophosphoryl diester phosphodiesterase
VLFDKQGHRGCRGLMPENTIPAFIKAIDLGVTTLELDVVITEDKQVLVSHEPFFNHEITTKADGTFINVENEKEFNIYKMSYLQTLQFDVGLKTHPRFPNQKKIKVNKPLLSDMIDKVEIYLKQKSGATITYNIETKCLSQTDTVFHPTPSEFVELLMKVVINKNVKERVTIQSFDIRTLQYLKLNYPTVKTSLLYEPIVKKSLSQQVTELGFVPDIYSPDYITVDASLVNECKNKSIQLIPWTVNDLEIMKHLKQLGVNGVISDYPNLFSKLL